MLAKKPSVSEPIKLKASSNNFWVAKRAASFGFSAVLKDLNARSHFAKRPLSSVAALVRLRHVASHLKKVLRLEEMATANDTTVSIRGSHF